MRSSWVIGGVALVALGLFLWLRGEGDGRGSRIESGVEPATVDAGEPAVDLAQAPLDAARALAEQAKPEPVTEDRATVEPTVDTRPSGRLSGTIVVVDLDGREFPGESGTLQLLLWNDEFGRGQGVEVRAGSWTLDLPPEGEEIVGVSVAGVRLGDRTTCALDADERRALPADGWLELRARWPAESLLRVLDRSSRRELAPVLFTELDGWPESECAHPGITPAQARDLGPSPVRLPEQEDGFAGNTRTVYVTSPGYSWSRIQVDEGRGGERIVELDPGGGLAVQVAGAQPTLNTRLRLYGERYEPIYDQPLRAHMTPIEALPAGDYRLRAEVGDFWSEPHVLAEEPVEIVAGVQARTTLTLILFTTPEDVPLAGTLSLSGWELPDFHLTLELLDTARNGRENRHTIHRRAMQPAVPGATYFLSWHAPPVQPGRYAFELSPCSYRAVLEVGPAGLLQADLVVPPPAEVFVRCRAEESEREPEGLAVLWYGAIPEGVQGWVQERAEHDQERGRWRFIAPAGEVTIALQGPGLASSYHTFQVRAGRNEIDLVAERLTGVRVILRDGTTEIPWEDDWVAFLVDPEPESESHFGWSMGAGSLTLHAPDAGRYRLKVPEIPGYEPVPEVLIELERGVVTEHVVELVRLP